jgi:hypothetical protein
VAVAGQVEFYVALLFDDISVLVEEAQIRFVEVLDDVQTQLEAGEAAMGVAGWLTHGDDQFPAFCLDKHFTPINKIPKERRYCVILETPGEEATFGLVCDEMDPLSPRYPLHLQELPDAMFNPESPIHKLALYEGGIGCLTDAMTLIAYLSAWGEARLAELEAAEAL